jgi:glycosyltransferase involved in cell wall biosynthesis
VTQVHLKDVTARSRGNRTVLMFLAKTFHKDIRPRLEAAALVKAKCKVVIFAWDRKFEINDTTTLDGARVWSFHHVRLGDESKIGLVLGAVTLQPLLLLASIKFIRRIRERPTIHSHDFNTLLPGKLLRNLGLASALVYDCHEFSFAAYTELFNKVLGKAVRVLEAHLVKSADLVITVSNPLAQYLGHFARQVHVIYNCPNKDDIPQLSKRKARAKLGLPVNKFVVANIGEIRYDSTVDLLLKAFSLKPVKGTGIHLLVIGHKGPLGHSVETDQGNLRRDQITVLPYVPRRTALTYMLASDLVWGVYRSESEESWNPRLTLPWKFFDSLACGVPIIVEKNTLRAKLVEKFGCGQVLEETNPDYVSQAIFSIYRDHRLHRSMVRACRIANARLDLNWEKMSKELAELYGKIP